MEDLVDRFLDREQQRTQLLSTTEKERINIGLEHRHTTTATDSASPMPGVATIEQVCPTVLDAEGEKDDSVLDLDDNNEDAVEQMPDRAPDSDVEEVQMAAEVTAQVTPIAGVKRWL